MKSPRQLSTPLVGVLLLGLVGIAGCATASGASSHAPGSATAVFGDFSAAELTSICVDATASAFAADVEFDTEHVRIEERAVDPRWLVLVPARTGQFNGEAQCTVGGEPASPDIEIANASIEKLPESQIQNLIVGDNEGGTR